jgi:hypothetical protein
MATNCRTDVMEVAVQHVDDIVGQQGFGERREAADVREENGKPLFLADDTGNC